MASRDPKRTVAVGVEDDVLARMGAHELDELREMLKLEKGTTKGRRLTKRRMRARRNISIKTIDS